MFGFFGKCGLFCFLITPGLKFAFLSYYGRYDFQNLQRKFMGFHHLILILNSKKDLHSCISCANISQFFGLNTRSFSKQSRTSLFLGILKKDFCWKLKFFCSFSGNKGLKIFSRRPFTTLNISVVRNKRFLIWK